MDDVWYVFIGLVFIITAAALFFLMFFASIAYIGGEDSKWWQRIFGVFGVLISLFYACLALIVIAPAVIGWLDERIDSDHMSEKERSYRDRQELISMHYSDCLSDEARDAHDDRRELDYDHCHTWYNNAVIALNEEYSDE